MHCPNCKNPDSKVTDSRTVADGWSVRRRRVCPKCNFRFTTYERIERTLPMIVKKDGRREAFDKTKVLKGMKKACQKRPIAMEELDKAMEQFEGEIMSRGEKEVTSSVVGEWVMNYLKQLDDVAFVRFASVYRSFKDVDEFMQELSHIIASRRTVKKNLT
ncbi:MAG: transcriptional regulator NrdR [Pseudomonadota bacterium]